MCYVDSMTCRHKPGDPECSQQTMPSWNVIKSGGESMENSEEETENIKLRVSGCFSFTI